MVGDGFSSEVRQKTSGTQNGGLVLEQAAVVSQGTKARHRVPTSPTDTTSPMCAALQSVDCPSRVGSRERMTLLHVSDAASGTRSLQPIPQFTDDNAEMSSAPCSTNNSTFFTDGHVSPHLFLGNDPVPTQVLTQASGTILGIPVKELGKMPPTPTRKASGNPAHMGSAGPGPISGRDLGSAQKLPKAPDKTRGSPPKESGDTSPAYSWNVAGNSAHVVSVHGPYPTQVALETGTCKVLTRGCFVHDGLVVYPIQPMQMTLSMGTSTQSARHCQKFN